MPKRKTEFAIAILAVLIGLVGTLVSYIVRTDATERNAQRISIGMTEEQVESILGAPNPLPGSRKQAFWDAYNLLGTRYVGVTVYYDAAGRVESKNVSTFWRIPPWR